MPRGPRLDVESGVYHVMARGMERRAIFRDDTDRQNFLRRLEAVADEEDLAVLAYVLMDNHFHVVASGGVAGPSAENCRPAPDRRRAVSAARRALARAVVVERGIRPVEVSRYLGVSRAVI